MLLPAMKRIGVAAALLLLFCGCDWCPPPDIREVGPHPKCMVGEYRYYIGTNVTHNIKEERLTLREDGALIQDTMFKDGTTYHGQGTWEYRGKGWYSIGGWRDTANIFESPPGFPPTQGVVGKAEFGCQPGCWLVLDPDKISTGYEKVK